DGGIVPQRYAPDSVADRRYYQPSRHGLEARVAERAERIRAILDQAGQAGQTDKAGLADRAGQTDKTGQTDRADQAGQAGKEQP
ncbi:MAG: hypothetical protein ACRDPF_34520, partial [Streptosporangiaceae bacterium]